jgi:alkylation response protein AidB-like acyl-CoA dehydrogenase
MPPATDEQRLPTDIDAQPPVQAAAALRLVIRGYRDELEREQRLPKALVEQCHAAGFYRLVRPRALGGLQADPLTYLRAVELLAEASGSVGWNVCNNNIAQLVKLGLPDEGIQEIYGYGGDVAIAGTTAAWPSAGVISTWSATRSRLCRSGTRSAAASY